jgi:hypothetical protein
MTLVPNRSSLGQSHIIRAYGRRAWDTFLFMEPLMKPFGQWAIAKAFDRCH